MNLSQETCFTHSIDFSEGEGRLVTRLPVFCCIFMPVFRLSRKAGIFLLLELGKGRTAVFLKYFVRTLYKSH